MSNSKENSETNEKSNLILQSEIQTVKVNVNKVFDSISFKDKEIINFT